jgi:hypothetical protein
MTASPKTISKGLARATSLEGQSSIKRRGEDCVGEIGGARRPRESCVRQSSLGIYGVSAGPKSFRHHLNGQSEKLRLAWESSDDILRAISDGIQDMPAPKKAIYAFLMSWRVKISSRNHSRRCKSLSLDWLANIQITA